MSEPIWIRDPAHDHIVFEGDEAHIVRKVLQCPEMQRLRRIRQLGFSSITYPGAEHTRFPHALGTAYLCSQALKRLSGKLAVSDFQRIAMIGAALLHDVGHGPFSHATEGALAAVESEAKNHETWTQEIVAGDSDVNGALAEIDSGLPDLIVQLLRGSDASNPTEQALHGILDGNLDVDRLDFLVRDSVHTGLKTGLVDVSRLIESLDVADGKIVVREKDLTNVEEFLIARHFMYQKVYFHKTTRGMEAVYKAWLRRMWDLGEELPETVLASPLLAFMRGEAGLDAMLRIDDYDVVQTAKALQEWDGDPVLVYLSNCLLHRRPFKAVLDTDEMSVEFDRQVAATTLLDERDYPQRYFYCEDISKDTPYDLRPYWDDPDSQDSVRIEVLHDGTAVEISQCSELVHSLMRKSERRRIYVPDEMKNDIAALFAT